MTNGKQQPADTQKGLLARAGAFVGRTLYRIVFLFGLMVLLSVVSLSMMIGRSAQVQQRALPDQMILTYVFKQGLDEIAGRPSLDQPLLQPVATIGEVIAALDHARRDPRVRGFVAKIEDPDFSVAQIQELRAAVARFRAAGKFTYVYGTGFGDGGGMGGYYLASGFDKIWLQPVGVVGLGGIAMEIPFVRELLDKIGVMPSFVHRGRYKSAPESLTETAMTTDARAMNDALVNDLAAQMISDIAASRALTLEDMQTRVAQGLFVDAQAVADKLVDHIGYADDMLTAAKERTGVDAAPSSDDVLIDLLDYGRREVPVYALSPQQEIVKQLNVKTAAVKPAPKKIALVYAVGEIVPYNRSNNSYGDGILSAERVVGTLNDLREDEDVLAVVLRIDSPGGSPTASETIRHALDRIRQNNKPVVISMGGMAASGGYWIATAGNRIVAQSGTLTGSIGIFGGKFVLAGLWDKLGVNWDHVSYGDHARMWSSQQDFTTAQRALYQQMLDHTYDAFLERVMYGRGMSRAQAEKVAEGRVYTGRQALAQGLVDDLGGVETAVAIARELAGVDVSADVPVVPYPGRKTALQLILELMTEGVFFTPRLDIGALTGMINSPAGAALAPYWQPNGR